MNGNQPQTVLMVIFGGAREPSRTFPHGTPIAPFSVGTQGEWTIVAPGVEPVHFYMGFDGREVHVAQATPTSRVFLDGHELVAGWHNARVGGELRFGGARLTVNSEEKRPTTQPFGRVEEVQPQNPGHPLRTQLIQRPVPITQPQPAGLGRSEPPAPAQGDRAQVLGFVPVQAAPYVQGAQGWQAAPPVATESEGQFGSTAKLYPRAGTAAPPQAAAQQPSPAENKLKPSPALVLGGTQLAVMPEAAPQLTLETLKSAEGALLGARGPEAAQQAQTVPGREFGYDEKGPSTLADGGALRDHAARVAAATPSVAFASAQAYVAEVRRASTPVPAGQLAAPEAGAPIAAPGLPANSPPGYARASQASAPDTELPAKKPSALARSWREASLVKKVTVALLPLGLAGVVLMPDEPAPEPAEPTEVPTTGASASASAAALPSAMANLATRGSPSASAGPSASASASAAALGSAVPAQAPSANAVTIEVSSARPSPSAASSARPLPATAEREALNAAFEGRNVEAARIYERLASAKGERVFTLAANLVRENIVLKPAISH